jgi:hypothetical protein
MIDPDIQETINALQSRREHHAKQLAENADFKAIQALDQAIAALSSKRANGGSSGRIPFQVPHHGRRLSQPAAAKQIILKHGKPVPTRQLLEEIGTLGVRVGGANPINNLVSVLSSRREEFKSVPWGDGRGWWVAGQPVPEE